MACLIRPVVAREVLVRRARVVSEPVTPYITANMAKRGKSKWAKRSAGNGGRSRTTRAMLLVEGQRVKDLVGQVHVGMLPWPASAASLIAGDHVTAHEP